MKNTKKILCILFALIALTLVMSLSIFAEETTGNVYEVNSESAFSTALSNSVDGDTILFTDNVTFGTTLYQITKAVTIDLNGFKITTNRTRNQFELNNAGIVITSSKDGGEIYHTGGICILLVKTADKIENIKLTSNRGENKIFALPDTNGCGGISVRGHINSIQNVTMDGPNLSYGIELYKVASNADLAQNVVLDNIINVSIDARRCGIKLAGNVGTATGCTFKGGVSGLEITAATDDKSYMSKINLVDCDVIGGSQAAEANGLSAYNINLVADADTTFTNSNDGIIFNFANYSGNNNVTFAVPGYAYADGVVKCTTPHIYVETVTSPTCTEVGYTTHACSKCVDFYNDNEVAATGHSYNSVVTDPTCTEAGYTTYTCNCGYSYVDDAVDALGHNYVGEEVDGTTVYTCTNCGDSYTCVHEYNVIESADVTCTEAGYVKSECALCGEVKTETTEEAKGHTYDWNICGCPKCGELAVLDEGSTNVSSNLGYTIYFATTLNDLSNTNYDVIRLKNNISLPSGGKITNANAIIDLGGNVLYRNGGYLGLRIVAAKGFVNGYVYKTNGGSQIMAVTSLEFMEDVTLAANSTKSNNATGLLMNTAGAYLGSMKNVTICAGVLSDLNSNNFDFVNVGTNGIYNHGIEATQGTIGSMENVKVSTYGQAITSAAKIGTMTNCVFSGDNIALNITTLQSEMKFVNCEIHSKNLAIYIANAVDSTEEAPVSFDIGNTKFVTDGAVFDISDHIIGSEMFTALTSAKALVNGQLYTSLEDAVNALVASTEEVTAFALIADLAVDSTIVINKKVNFSFGGASYDVPVYGTNQVTHKTVSGYTVTSSVDVVFNVVEGGYLTISGAGVLEGTETAIVADGGTVVITAGTYVGYNPREFVSIESCVVNNEDTYTITAEHDYDDDVGADKTTYQVDGVCNNCGYVRGIYAVDNVYYMTLEEALAAAIANGKQIVLAADLVLDEETVWDLTGATFNFNSLTITGSLSIVGGSFTQDVSEYLSDDYCCAYKSNTRNYLVAAHECVAGTPAEDGSVTYTCANCGETYVINNAAVNGTYYLGTDEVVFANGVLTAMGGEYTYENNLTTGMITTSDEAIYFSVLDGVIYFKGATQLHQHTEDVEYIVESTDATCTENGSIVTICPFGCIVSEEIIEAAGHQYFYPCDVVCMVCYEETNPDATHNIVYVEAVEATCQATGNVEYWYCSDCGSAWLDEAQTQITNLRSVITVGDHIAAWDFSDEETGYVGAYEWVNATCMAEGYHKDKCATCGEVMVFETFPVDTEYGHVVVEGTYTQVDANCKDAGSFSYECEVCGETITGEIEVDPYAHVYDDGAIVDGKLVYTCTVCGGTEEKVVVELVVGDNTVNFTYVESMWGGSYEAPYVIITAPGKYTITSTEASFDLYGGRGNFTWIEELPYEFEVAEGEYVIFVLSGTVSWDQTSAVVTLAEAGCSHANTEEIPAVLPAPSNNHTGMTAGVKCLDCEAVIVEPVETVATSTTNWSVFGVQNMSLALSNNIAINYNINVSNGYNDVYMVFVYEGTEYIYTEYTVESSNRIVFKFDKTRPHKMASNVDGYVYSSTANGYVVDTIPGGYSIMKYCQQAIDAYKGKDEVFVKLIYDLIAYGAAVQKYENKNISDAELVTTMMEEAGYELAPTEFVGIGEASSISYVDKEPSKYYWYDVQLMLGSSTVLYYNFQAPDIDGLTIKVEYSDQTIIFENEDIVSLGGNNYRIEIGTLASTQYVYDVKATFITAEGQEASSMTWSINGYLKVAVDAFSGETKELMEALYIYGESIRAYFNN